MKKKNWIREILVWFLSLVFSAIILILVSKIFPKTLELDLTNYGIWTILVAFFISVLNKTIKPIIVWLTLPLTGLTFGLFYPFINVLILNMADFCMGSHFSIHGIGMSFLVAIMISIMNVFMDHYILKPILGGKNE